MKAALSNSKRELQRTHLRNEQLNDAKESMSSQLQLRKRQLEELQNTANSFTKTLKKAELGIQQKEKDQTALELKVSPEDFRLFSVITRPRSNVNHVKNLDIQRSIGLLKKDLQDPADIEAKIDNSKKKLEVQVLESELLCRELESPNQDRLRVLDAGEDPSEEELAAKLATLERLVHQKNEVLLAGEISSNEIAFQIQELDETLQSYKIATHSILQGINEYQSRVQEKQRLCTAHMSEIRMYEELTAASKSKISELENGILLREQLLLATEGENEHADLSAGILRTAANPSKSNGCERPTGYLPGDDDETTIKVPRPYGAQTPFKAGAVKKAESKN
jgi:hypothetical protein